MKKQRHNRWLAVSGGGFVVLALCLLVWWPTLATSFTGYCAIPPQNEGGAQKPNVVILLDNSGSMHETAYSDSKSQRFNPDKEYYGFLDPNVCYDYDTVKEYFYTAVVPVATINKYECDEATNGGYPFSGNFINWMYTLRMDVIKMVLTGGRYDGIFRLTEDADRTPMEHYCLDPAKYTDLKTGAYTGVGFTRYGSAATTETNKNSKSATYGGDKMRLFGVTGCDSANDGSSTPSGTRDTLSISKLNDHPFRVIATIAPTGLLHDVKNSVRLGFHILHNPSSLGTTYPGGTLYDQIGGSRVYCYDADGDDDWENCERTYLGTDYQKIILAINDLTATSETNLAESLFSIVNMFRQVTPYYPKNKTDDDSRYEYSLTHVQSDPYYEWEGDLSTVPCRNSYVLLLTDGGPTNDINIPDTYLGEPTGGKTFRDFDGDGDDAALPPQENPANWPPAPFTDVTGWGKPLNWLGLDSQGNPPPTPRQASEYLDDIALYAHTQDLRPDIEGTQTFETIVVYAFGDLTAGPYVAWNTAINGGFEDLNNDGIPSGILTNNWNDNAEWDSDGDDIPDNFFYVEDGNFLEASLRSAFEETLGRAASGTNSSIQTASGEGEGLVVQAFYQDELRNGNQVVSWIGYLRGLWVDRFGNLREDSNNGHRGQLVLTEDKIIKFRYDEEEKRTVVDYYEDDDGDGKLDPPYAPSNTSGVEELVGVFNAEQLLHARSASSRTIYANVDPTGTPEPTLVNFSTSSAKLKVDANSNGTDDLFGVPVAEVDDLINYVRGVDQPALGWRSRTITNAGTTGVWKLGDIVHSSPLVVSAPPSRYDIIYGDQSYAEYYALHRSRRSVVYVGGNDGMLHAFNLGQFINGDDPDTDNIEEATYDGDGYTVGEELWGLIPYNALSTLQYLKSQQYCHLYYIDGEPSVFDAKIFKPDASHVNGWGTVLLLTMRLACPTAIADADSKDAVPASTSALLIVDVTDPLTPKLVYEFATSMVGMQLAAPQIIRIDPDDPAVDDGDEEWFVTVAAGVDSDDPQYYEVLDGVGGGIFFLNLSGGASGGVDFGLMGSLKALVNTPYALDFNLEYSVSHIYLTTTIIDPVGPELDGVIYRIQTNHDVDPNNWEITEIFDSLMPFSTPPVLDFGVGGFNYVTNTFESEAESLNIYVGTGRYYSNVDKANLETNAFMRLRDDCFNDANCPASPWEIPDLLDVTGCYYDIADSLGIEGCDDNTLDETTIDSRLLFNNSPKANQGWKIMLNSNPGERVLSPAVVQGDFTNSKTVLFTTYQPTQDVCASAGRARLYLASAERGVSYYEDPIDVGVGQQQPTVRGAQVFLGSSLGAVEIFNNDFSSSAIEGVIYLQRALQSTR